MKTLVLLTALATLGPARSPAARQAEEAFEAGDYETAAKAAAEAYAADGDPVFLYVRAQAERFGGDCESALVHYREFIDAVPPGPATEAALDNIAECEQAMAQTPEPPPPAESTQDPGGPGPTPAGTLDAGEPVVPADPEPVVDDEPRARPWYRDPWGGTLVGVGAVAIGVGGALYGVARADARAAGEANDVGTYGDRIDRAYTLSRVGPAVLGVGGALVIAGVVRWAMLARRGRSSDAPKVALGRGGIVMRW